MITVKKILSSLLVMSSLIFIVSCASTAKQEGAGEYVDDSIITARVKAAILGEPTLKVSEINVETYKGVVQLSGFVGAYADEGVAVKAAKDVSGVKSVKNDMHVK
jgi:osmotically-inducible protein OsmY